MDGDSLDKIRARAKQLLKKMREQQSKISKQLDNVASLQKDFQDENNTSVEDLLSKANVAANILRSLDIDKIKKMQLQSEQLQKSLDTQIHIVERHLYEKQENLKNLQVQYDAVSKPYEELQEKIEKDRGIFAFIRRWWNKRKLYKILPPMLELERSMTDLESQIERDEGTIKNLQEQRNELRSITKEQQNQSARLELLKQEQFKIPTEKALVKKIVDLRNIKIDCSDVLSQSDSIETLQAFSTRTSRQDARQNKQNNHRKPDPRKNNSPSSNPNL